MNRNTFYTTTYSPTIDTLIVNELTPDGIGKCRVFRNLEVILCKGIDISELPSLCERLHGISTEGSHTSEVILMARGVLPELRFTVARDIIDCDENEVHYSLI